MSLELRPDPGYQPPPLDPGEKSVSPLLVFSIIWHRKYAILFVAIILSGIANWAIWRIQPSFVATAQVLMQDRKPVVTDTPTAMGTATDSVTVRTQVDIMRSPSLARGIVDQLHLIDLPEFSPNPGMLARLIDVLTPWDRFGLLTMLGLDAPGPPVTQEERAQTATQILMGMTAIVNDGHSYVIEIKTTGHASDEADIDRARMLSAMLSNAYADAYVQFTRKVKSDSIRQANEFFDDRLASLRDKMRAAQHAVQTYRSENGLVEDRPSVNDGRAVTVAGQQLTQLNTDLVAAISDRAKKEASLDQITMALAGHGDLSSVPEVIASPLIQSLRQQEATLSGKAAALSVSQLSNSPELIAVKASLRNVNNAILAQTEKIVASLRSAVAAASSRESALRSRLAQLQSNVAAQGQTEVRLVELENEADTARLIYTTYLKRSEETANEVDMQQPDALVLSRAQSPLASVPPTRKQLAVVAILASFVASVLLAVVRERLRPGYRTAEQVASSIGATALGSVPKVGNPRKALRFTGRHSAFSESIFSIRALLRLNLRVGPKVILVTSALPREGKTFLSSSLARNAALAGERTLLIDCDLRRPAVARNIDTTDLRALDGITIRRDGLSCLDVITLPRDGISPQDFFASVAMRDMIEMLRKHYDMIVLDAPPVLAVSDARVLSRLADATVLVVRWQKTPEAFVTAAASALRAGGTWVAGAVLTQVRLRDLTASEGGHAYVYQKYSKYLTT